MRMSSKQLINFQNNTIIRIKNETSLCKTMDFLLYLDLKLVKRKYCIKAKATQIKERKKQEHLTQLVKYFHYD